MDRGGQKGLPNFNEYSVESLVQVSRRLEVNKRHINNIHPSMSAKGRTKCIRLASRTCSAWRNSYTSTYPRRLAMDVRQSYQIGLWDHGITNRAGQVLPVLILICLNLTNFTTP